MGYSSAPHWLLIPLLCAFASACATPGPGRSAAARHPDVVQNALEMVGKPYRWGGSSPRGFDCSGLVLYSYRAAGIAGLPHSVRGLQNVATPLRVSQAEPGDLLFFELSGKKAAHVAIYVGQREFVHAPSGGKQVEKVSFDHVYWGRQLRRANAGRIAR